MDSLANEGKVAEDRKGFIKLLEVDEALVLNKLMNTVKVSLVDKPPQSDAFSVNLNSSPNPSAVERNFPLSSTLVKLG